MQQISSVLIPCALVMLVAASVSSDESHVRVTRGERSFIHSTTSDLPTDDTQRQRRATPDLDSNATTLIVKPSVIDTNKGLVGVAAGSKVKPPANSIIGTPQGAFKTPDNTGNNKNNDSKKKDGELEGGIMAKPSVVDTNAGLVSLPNGSVVVPPNGSIVNTPQGSFAANRNRREAQGILTKSSVVDTPAGLVSVPSGSVIVPPNGSVVNTPQGSFAPNRNRREAQGILTKSSVVDTPAGLVGVPSGSVIVPPQGSVVGTPQGSVVIPPDSPLHGRSRRQPAGDEQKSEVKRLTEKTITQQVNGGPIETFHQVERETLRNNNQ